MPLQQGIQLVVTVKRGAGRRLACAAFDGLALPSPVLVQFTHVGTAASQATMERLVAALLAELGGRVRANALPTPCRGAARQCHAVNAPDCQKLLVLVGDGVTPARWTKIPAQWRTGGSDFAVLPVLPETARNHTGKLLPGRLSVPNVAFWDRDIEEAITSVFQAAGVTEAQPRVFISYRQIDTAAAAIQLFDALSHDSFDVFLDHFRVAPGVDFQARLRQELGDKSLVLVLESSDLPNSRWVAFEIAVAKACGLGLLAVNFDNAAQISGIAPSLRHALSAGDLAPDRTLRQPALDAVRAFVRREHDLSILRRRILLEQSFEQAVVQAGGATIRQADGSFRVDGSAKSYQTWLTHRPPELPDFHRAHGAAQPQVEGVMIGLSQLMEVSRQRQQEWLAGLCDMILVDEGVMAQAAGDMVRGVL